MNYNDGHHTKFFVLFPHASLEICVFFTGMTGYGLQDIKDVLTALLALFFSAFWILRRNSCYSHWVCNVS